MKNAKYKKPNLKTSLIIWPTMTMKGPRSEKALAFFKRRSQIKMIVIAIKRMCSRAMKFVW